MLLLVSTSDKIQVTQTTARTLDIHASWVDHASGTVTPGRTNTLMTTAATADVVAAPAASTQRNIQTLVVRNRDTISATVTIKHTDGTTTVELFAGVLLPSEQVLFIDGAGFQLTSTVEIANRTRLSGDVISSSATPTVVAGLTKTLSVGTWVFRYTLIYRSSLQTVGCKPDVNFTGSRSFFVFNMRWVDSAAGASTGPSQDSTLATGAVMSAMSRRAPSTAGIAFVNVDALNADMMLLIEGTVDVTVTGDLELYWGAELGTANLTLFAGSTLWLEPYGS